MLNDRTHITLANQDDVDFLFNANMSKDSIVTLKGLEELASGQLVNFKAKVSEIRGSVQHTTKTGESIPKQEIILLDGTRSMKLILYADYVDGLAEGKSYFIQNARLNIVDSKCYLNTPLATEFIFKEIDVVDDSLEGETRINLRCKVIGLKSLHRKVMCSICYKTCDWKDDKTVHCGNCNVTVLAKACTVTWTCHLVVKNNSTADSYVAVLYNMIKSDVLPTSWKQIWRMKMNLRSTYGISLMSQSTCAMT